MNINMIRDADNDAGIYAAACSLDPLAAWSGASLYVSADGGASYASVATIPNESSVGYATDALGDFASGNIADELNSVNVMLLHGSLSSTTFDGLLSGVNTCVIGDEILFFRDVTLESNGSYTLRGFLRGRRGSEYAMSGHATGDRFVLADVATLVRVPRATSDIGAPLSYKPVTAGGSLAGTTAQTFTNLGTGLKPYAPVLLGGGRNAGGDVTLSWIRRNRISGEWRDSVDVPNSEASEAYEVEIYTAGYGTLKRTIAGLSSPTAAYSAAEQTADFGSPQSTVNFKVYQLSAVVGRGHAAIGSV